MKRILVVFILVVVVFPMLATDADARLRLQGSTADKAAFLAMLAQFTGHHLSIDQDGYVTDNGESPDPDSASCPCLAELVGSVIDYTKKVVLINVGRSTKNVLVDRFKGKHADLDDLDTIPASPEGDQVSRGETIAHIIGEYYYAAKNHAGYARSHKNGGLAEQNKYRAAKGKVLVKASTREDDEPTLEVVLEDDRKEVWEIKDDNIENITPPPPAEERQRIAQASAQSDTIAFWGTVLSVASAPCAWSGTHVATIVVEYQVDDVVMGSLGSTVTVEHAVAEAPDTCVAPSIYSSPNQLFVSAKLVTGFTRGPIYLALEEPSEAIPTVSFWAMVVLLTVLLGVGVWHTVRQRRIVV